MEDGSVEDGSVEDGSVVGTAIGWRYRSVEVKSGCD